jgi:hypothetical protein
MEDLDPQSFMECELVERLGGITWRLRRVPFFEAAILGYRQAQVEEENRQKEERRPHLWLDDENEEHDDGDADDEDKGMSDEERSAFVGNCLIEDGVFGDGLGKLARHEAALMNALTKTMQMFLLLQENRSTAKIEPVVLKAVALPTAA